MNECVYLHDDEVGDGVHADVSREAQQVSKDACEDHSEGQVVSDVHPLGDDAAEKRNVALTRSRSYNRKSSQKLQPCKIQRNLL
jgi:hypothetical protein